MRLFGQLFGKSERAEEFISWRQAEIRRVTDVIEKAKPGHPTVFIDRAGGYSDECCMSFGDDNFGKFVEMACGANIAKGIFPGTFGTINPEQIIASNPDHIIVTGGWWEAYVPGGAWVDVGPGRDETEALRKLAALAKRPALTGVKAVETGDARNLAPVLQQPIPIRRHPADGHVAASGPLRGSRSRGHVPGTAQTLPAGRIQARTLGVAVRCRMKRQPLR